MPYETWMADALAHYIALAELPVPNARALALVMAGTAEAKSAGALAGLEAQVRAATEPPRPERPTTTNRRT